MIVDDEYMVREGLKKGIDWNSHGYFICDEAENGEEALEKICKNCPDILLVDIKMPVMDGLELIKNIYELKFPTRIIILTCYEDFKYAQKAIYYGVDEYILKLSSRPSDILKAIDRVKIKILEERSKRIDVQSSKLLSYSMLFSPYYSEIVPCFFAYIVIDDSFSAQNISTAELFLLSKLEVFFKEYNYYIFKKSNNAYIMMLSSENIAIFTEKFKNIIEEIRQLFNICVYSGVSKIRDKKADSIELFVEQAKSAGEFRFYKQDQHIFLYDQVNYRFTSFRLDEIRIRNYLENSMYEEMIQYVNYMLKAVKYIPVSDILNYCIELIWIIIQNFRLNDICAPTEFSNLEGIGNYINKFDTYEKLVQGLLNIIKHLMTMFHSCNTNEKLIIRKMKDIIAERYSENLTLERISRELNMSYSYLSNLFKVCVGYSFNEYLNIYRINKAKELLRKQNENIYLISEKVGYSNPYYFSRVFRKYTKMTPSEYRNKFYK